MDLAHHHASDHAGDFAFDPPRTAVPHRLVESIRELVQTKGLERLPEPIRLASGAMSSEFIDGKHVIEDPDDYDRVGAAMCALASEHGVEFDAVGGLVLGAAPYTFAVASAARCKWFLIRKEPKGRGTNLWIEGSRLAAGTRVMLVDDVVTLGGSIRTAYEKVTDAGAEVVFATTLVDRSDYATETFESLGVPYQPLLTYRDLDIPPVHLEPQHA